MAASSLLHLSGRRENGVENPLTRARPVFKSPATLFHLSSDGVTSSVNLDEK